MEVTGRPALAPWDPSSKANLDALTLLCLRVALAMSPTRKGIPLYPETEEEKAFVARFRERYPVEEREAALEATLNFFVGGALLGALEDSTPRRKVIKSQTRPQEPPISRKRLGGVTDVTEVTAILMGGHRA